MASKSLLILYVTAGFVKMITAQCLTEELLASNIIGNKGAYGAGFPGQYNYGGYGPGQAGSVAPTSGGGFVVTSVSPITPNGVTVVSENAIEGALIVTGELPFLGAIALEGALPTLGAGAINYGCGDGNVAIVTEGLAPVGPTYGPNGLGYAPGLAGGVAYASGLGYGGLY